ncbi:MULTISPECIES: RNA polymerase sigma factor [unclassified Breznakia]|uniref:RNA polymerase sigma factor n=1 Tax=unclassified Breznakia TaxID=2623764 RepID=UPI00247718C3|nr:MULTISPECIES: RNA polymerase sigma factor [unclassified Breznakia]MDH6365952.1 RNA polymerase sigma factor (sigma-70 family) [Breznakia sp. PH1-1]MDH6403116.1 RNA polymerase sigma factor (sigma-70 family) [Breznakia sp. PF1-11]MDH6410825.1 RNA polymerase sigma factor (sigma-70 family) [Breznakia sp. PFB1-11]MDH6413118.1 RNA polymerase sigma factor (sigma-70 family) [Breznakia sp. PFB1-14]MDH6415486.1 RNA polymerase sigma factor (sigma-70 family) [Breznakia sp. PFB1-4]
MKDKEKLKDLIVKVKEGNQEAFEELYRAYVNNVYFKALNYFHDEVTARDVVQDVFIRIHKNIHKLDNPGAFYTWIIRITYNVCYDYDKKKDQVVDLGSEYTIEDFEDFNQKDASAILENKELQQTIYEGIQSLRTPLRTVGILRYYDELSVSEISDVLQIPEGTVHSRLHSMKVKLKEVLEEQGISSRSLSGFVLTPTLLKLAFEAGANHISVPVTMSSATLIGVSKEALTTASTKSGWMASTKVALVSTIGVASLVGLYFFNQPQSTPLEDNHPDPIVQQPATAVKEHAKIKDITYPTAWTNTAYALQVTTTSDVYDEILLNGNQDLTVVDNGEYVVTLQYEGKQIDERIITIQNFDFASPTVPDYTIEQTSYTIALADTLSGIDFSQTRCEKDGQYIQKDIHFDPSTNTISLDCAYGSREIVYIYDHAGNELKLVLRDGNR